MAQTGFKIINDSLKAKDPSRGQVNTPTHTGTDGRSSINHGKQNNSPETYFASGLEARHGEASIFMNRGPERDCVVPKQNMITHRSGTSGYHRHMSTPTVKRAHSFAGRRK